MAEKTASWEDKKNQNLHCTYDTPATLLGSLKYVILVNNHNNPMTQLSLACK